MRFLPSLTPPQPTEPTQSSGPPPAPTPSLRSPAPTPPPSLQTLPRPSPPAASSSNPVDGAGMSSELGKCVQSDRLLLRKLGWREFIKHKRPRSDFASLDKVDHPARRLLKLLKNRGAPVRFSTEPWSQERISQALQRGAHQSCLSHIEFLHEEFADMIHKGQFVVLPAREVMHLPGLRIAPPGVVEQRERRPRTIIDYSFNGVNSETLPLAAMEAMQFGHALDRILREILLSDPALGPVKMMKIDLSDGFYRVALNIDDIPKLGIVFPTKPGEEQLIAFPLVLPMGWCNSPPHFSTVTETAADLTNARLAADAPDIPHPLDDAAEAATPEIQEPAPVPTPLVASTEVPTERDPCLPATGRPLGYADIFVDDFIGLAQECTTGQRSHPRRVRRLLLHAIDDVFRPNDSRDNQYRREPVSLKKLRKGDCSWSTIKLVLGWIIDTVNMTIHLPKHRVDRLAEILASIPVHQKRTSVRKWHKVLGELRSMALALPGARNLFSTMQRALASKIGGRVALNKGVHQALDDFRWLLHDITSRPTRIAELVPLAASADGHHDASGRGAGGVWFPSPSLKPREGFSHRPVVWRLEWPQFVIDKLVSSDNPGGTISNSDLELAGGLIHLEALAQTFDIRERTVLSRTDNLNTLFWQRKGGTSSDKVPAHLLRLFGIHQRFHRYVPRHDYLSGPSNPIADALSRDFHLSWPELLTTLNVHLPQPSSCQIWTPTKQMISSVISALLKKRSDPASLLVAPSATTLDGASGSASALSWASTPLSKPRQTKLRSYCSSPNEFVRENLRPEAIPSSLDRLKITYGELPRRSLDWVGATRA